MRITSFIILSLIILTSCKKEEGEGGIFSIKGKVILNEYSKFNNNLIRTYDAMEEDVYIVYGDDEFYGDKVETHFDGSFEFNYITKGDYKIFVYSDDTTNLEETTIVQDVIIADNKSVKDLPTFNVCKIVEKGEASIRGKLFAFDYELSTGILKDTFYLADEDVYIARKGESMYFDNCNTFYDGSFAFDELLPGEYEVYAYSKTNSSAGITAVVKNVIISDFYQDIEIERIEIIK